MIPFLAAAALKMSPVGAFLKRIPRGVWIALAVAAVIALGAFMHGRAVKHAYAAAYTQGKADEGARIEAKAKAIADRATAISETLRSMNNVENRRIAGVADALRVRGPGKASCLNSAAAGTSGRKPASGIANAPGPQVPSGEREPLLAAVPWPWLVNRAETCDLNRVEVLTWREWHRLLVEDYEKQH